MEYRSERIKRREEEKKRERIHHHLRITGGILAGVVVIVLGYLAYREDARIIDGMKKHSAEEMATCLMDWKDGNNGGCDWEVKRFRDGTPYAVEVVAKK